MGRGLAPASLTNVCRWNPRLLQLLAIFLVSFGGLVFVYLNFPPLNPSEKQHLRLPRSLQEAKLLGHVLNKYRSDHFYAVYGGVFLTYIFLQSFAIPGSIFLSVLSGYLFPFVSALLLICTCSAVGACVCYFLSMVVGKSLLLQLFPDRLAKLNDQVMRHQGNLLSLMLFLRVTPILPNWFINIASACIGVPIFPFFIGTFLGVAPPSVLAIQAGTALNDLATIGSIFTWKAISLLGLCAAVPLISIVSRRNVSATD